MFDFGVMDGLKIGAGAVLGAALAAVPVYWYGHSVGVNSERLAAHVEALDRIEDMGKRNDEFENLSALERCRVIMRDSGLSDDICNKRFGLSDGQVFEP